MPEKSVLAVAVALAFGAPTYESRAQTVAPTTLPTGGRIVGGQAAITQSGASMAIHQTTNKAALDWQSFSIGSQAAVRFNQPNASSMALNRVLGNDGSQILGQLSANGQIFLINPNGILFGRGAQVDTGGLVASTLNMSSEDFMSGRYLLRNPGNSRPIVNEGTIKGRFTALVAPGVTNEGTIESRHGSVSLSAANAATVDLLADGLVQIKVDEGALAAQIANHGVIRADGGVITLTAAARDNLARSIVNNTGIIEARTVERVDGVVRLGTIKVLADEVNVTGKSRLDASGDAGGGEILVGGNYQGKGPEANALTATIGPDVVISADAHKAGDGGKVIVWADDRANVHGTITARGGPQSGNGGLIETSAHTIDVKGIRVDAGAPNGQAGLWFLDPINVRVYHTGFSAGPNDIEDATITAALNSGTNVTITTAGSGGDGDITLNGTADPGGAVTILNGTGGMRTLTLQADRDIDVRAGAFIGGTSTTNSLATTLNSNRSDGGGAINFGGTLNSFGGEIQLVGGSTGTGFAKSRVDGTAGIALNGASLDAGAGAITIKGDGFTSGTNVGVLVQNSNVATSGTMAVSANGHLNILSTATPTELSGNGQQIVASGTIKLQGAAVGANNSAQIRNIVSSTSNQVISANAIVLQGGSGSAADHSETNNFAQILNQGSTGSNQNVTVDVGGISLAGGSGTGTDHFAGLSSATTQTVTVNNGGAINLFGGSSSQSNVGSTHGSRAFFSLATGGTLQQINFPNGGSISITGGTNGTGNFAVINAFTGDQTITGSPTITLTGGASGGITNEENQAAISAQAAAAVQNITSSNMTIRGGGTGSTVNFAGINATTQNITVHGDLLIEGKESGPARIGGLGGSPTNLTLGVDGKVTLTAGTVSTAGARIGSNGSGGVTANIDLTAGGDITLNGGSGQAWIGNPSSAPAAGTIVLNAGGNIAINGQVASASIGTLGTLSVDAVGSLSLAAGTGSGAVAMLSGEGVTVHAGSLNITGGSGAANNSAHIRATTGGRTVTVAVDGNTVLTGGGSTDSNALIGMSSTGEGNTVTVNFTGGGDLTLNGGSATDAGAAIGAGRSQTNATTNVSISAANVTLNDGPAQGSRFGHNSASPGPGDITVTAAGNIAFNAANGIGTNVRTTGNVTLHADAPGKSISQASASLISTGNLAATANSGINLAGTGNAIGNFTGTNATTGGINLVNTGNLTLNGGVNAGAGAIAIATSGNLSQTSGAVSGGNVSLNAGGGIGPVSTASTGTLSLSTSGIGSAGDISVTELNALNTNRLVLATDVGSQQAITLTSTNSGGITVGGNLDVSAMGNDNLKLIAGSGSIVGGTGRLTTGGTGTLVLQGNNIGSAAAPVLTNIGSGTLEFNPNAAGGNVYVSNNSVGGLASTQLASNLSGFTDSHAISLQQTVGNFILQSEGMLIDSGNGTGQTGTLILDAPSGSIAFGSGAVSGGPLVHARNVVLHASADIGASGSRILVDAERLTARSETGSVYIEANPVRSFISSAPATAMVQRVYNTVTLQDQAGWSNGASGTYDLFTGVGPISIAGPVSAGPAGVRLAAPGTISESGTGFISTSGLLMTNSIGGLSLGGANAVSQFNATNTGSGSITLVNAAPLNVAGIGSAIDGSVSITNTGGMQINAPITTTGAGNITLTADNFGLGPAIAIGNTAGIAANGTGSVVITGTAHGAGSGVFVGSSVTAQNGDVTITGAGGVSSDATSVMGVGIGGPALPGTIGVSGNIVTITGQGGTATGSSLSSSGPSPSAQGVGINKATIDGRSQVSITGIGGSSTTQGAAGVIISNGSHVGGDGTAVTITGTGGTSGGSSGGGATGVIIGSQVDTVGSDISTMGLVTINGTGGTGNNTGATGIAIFGPSNQRSIVESLGGIVMNGTGGTVAGTGSAAGVSLLNTLVQTASTTSSPSPKHISITGHGGTSSGGSNATGIGVADGSLIQTQGFDVPQIGGFQTGFGNITLIGIAGTAAGAGGANGVSLANLNTPSTGGAIRTNIGSIVINGTGGTSATGEARGVVLRAASAVESANGGAISLSGLGGTSSATGTATVTGVGIGAQSLVQTSGAIALVGNGGTNLGAGNAGGVGVSDGAFINALNNGSLTITGTGGVAQSGGSTHGISAQPFTTTSGSSINADLGTLTLNGTVGSLGATSSAVNIVDSAVVTHGAMNVTAAGTLSIAASNNGAQLSSNGMQTVNATGIRMTGAPSGTGSHAFMTSQGGQAITVGPLGIVLTGGGGTNNGVDIHQDGATSDQSITINGGGSVVLTGGTGTQSGALIFNRGRAQTLTFASGGTLTLQGGSGAGGDNSANVANAGLNATTQTIAFPAGGSIDIAGGTVGADNFAAIEAERGNQAITGTADIALTGGASGGGATTGNTAGIELGHNTASATQSISARNIVMTGGAGGTENMALITTNLTGQRTTINATGSLTLAGGAGAEGGAVIGADLVDANITINAAGAITLTQGAGATVDLGPVAAIGTAGGGTADITIAGGNFSLNGPLAGIGAMQGGGGALSISGANVALGDGFLKTTGNVTLAATGQITQSTGGVNAAALATTSAAGTALTGANTVPVFSASNSTSGGIAFTDTASTLTLGAINQAGSGTLSVSNTGGINVGGAVSSNGGVALTASGAITNAPGASINAAGNASFAGASVTLGNQAGDAMNFGTLTFNSPGAVDISEDSATTLAGGSTANTLVLNSLGAITNAIGATLSVTNGATLNANSISLGNQSGDLFNFGSLIFTSAGGVNLSEDSTMNLAGTSSAGTSASLASTDQIVGAVNAPALALASTNGATLTTQANALTVANTSNNVTINNTGVLGLNGVTNTNGGFTLDNIGHVTVTAPVQVGTFASITAHSDINLQSNVVAPGGVTLAATTDSTSNITQSAGTTVNAGGSAVSVGAGGAINMSGSLSGTNLSATTSGGSVMLPTSNLTGSLTVNTSGGNIGETGSLTVAGTTSLQAGSGTITLASASNDFTGSVSATGTGGVSLADANTLTLSTVNAGTGSATLSATSLSGSGPVTASTATLSSTTPVSGLTTNVSNTITVTGGATSWNLSNQGPATVVTTTVGISVLDDGACVAGCAPLTVSTVTGGVDPTTLITSTTSTTSSSTGSATSSSGTSMSAPTLAFSTSLAPSAASSPIQIVSAPTATTSTAAASPSVSSAPSTSSTSTTTSTATSAPADTSTSTSTSPSSETSSSTSSSSQSQGEAQQQEGGDSRSSGSQSGGRQQTASTSRTTGRTSGGAALSATAARLVASMQELHAQKVQALEKGVDILERNPAAADLKPCGGAQLSGDCIAQRPSAPRAVTASLRTPTLVNLPTIQRKVALLIGVNDYRGAIPKLNSPLKDIQEIGKIYREQFGYEVRTLPNADKATIVRALNRLILESGPNDSVTVFYAGHGQVIEKTGRGYWIPARASADDPTQWISNQDIGRALENIPAKQVLLVSDSCYSGSLTRDAKVQRDEVLPDPSAVLQRRSVTVLSSGGEEPVADQGRDGHSVFAWHYMQALRSVEKWSNGIDVHERLAASVSQEFPQEPQYGEAMGSGHQRGGDFLFEVRKY